MKTVKQLAEEIGDLWFESTEFVSQVESLLTDFVKEIETEVIGEDEVVDMQEIESSGYGAADWEAYQRNILRLQQRSKLQQILKDQKEEV